MRAALRRPAAAATRSARPTTTAQFAPDTAVRWLSELPFIARSRSSPTADVSPMASPGRSAPPSPGSEAASSANLSLRSLPQSMIHGGSPVTTGGACAKNRNATSSSNAADCTVPSIDRVEPIPMRSAGGSAKTRTGIDVDRRDLPTVAVVIVAAKNSLDGTIVEVSVAVAATWRDADAASRRRSGCRSPARTPTTEQTRATAAQHTPASTSGRRRVMTSPIARAQAARSAHSGTPGRAIARAAAAHAAAAGIARRKSTP